MTSKQLTIVGACNVDLISYVDRLPKAGETIMGTSYEVGFGGKGANQCSAAANLLPENSCQFVSGLGNDDHGKNYLSHLRSLKIDTKHVQVFADQSTGVAPIAVDTSSGENSIIIIPGANLKYEISETAVENASLVICQNESGVGTTENALKFGYQRGVHTVLNPSPVEGVTDAMLNNTTILILNEHELLHLSPGKKVQNLFQKYMSLKFIVVTLGEKGATVYGKMGDEFTQIVSKSLAIGRSVGPVVDTTGAGDCFLGSFAAFYHRKIFGKIDPKLCAFADLYCKICEAVQFACDVASVSVEKKGTSKSYPKLEELEGFGIEF